VDNEVRGMAANELKCAPVAQMITVYPMSITKIGIWTKSRSKCGPNVDLNPPT